MDYLITEKDKKTLLELCELSLRTQRERLSELEYEFPESNEIKISTKKMYKKLLEQELIVDKLRQLQTQE